VSVFTLIAIDRGFNSGRVKPKTKKNWCLQFLH